ncbi:MAG: putative toxin-antitoxin system toxin component, PIN family [Acidobacteriaceae bacterium]|nr:putative toxin-antitoxin system toxin component, PIN family [Acidobacteriaceae bacterium]
MRLVVDTDVIVAAIRSPTGASAALLRYLDQGLATILLSVPLALEYEAKCQLPEHRLICQLSTEEVDAFINTLIAISEPVHIRFVWRPQVRDPNDEMVLETAVNGGADAIVTFNQRHFAEPSRRFGIPALLPREALKAVRT